VNGASVIKDVYKLPRLFVDVEHLRVGGDPVILDNDSSHYIANVMRLKAGYFFRIFNGRSGEYLCELTSVDKPKSRSTPMSVSVSITRQLRSLPFAATTVGGGNNGDIDIGSNVYANTKEPSSSSTSFCSSSSSFPCVLYFAPIKKTRLKTMFEKATELGVDRFVPVTTQNTNEPFEALGKLDRTLIESAEQSERLTVPILEPVAVTLDALLREMRSSSTSSGSSSSIQKQHPQVLYVCRERGVNDVPLLSALLEELQQQQQQQQQVVQPSFGLLVGPEGGFTAKEFEEMAQYPFVRFASLGPTVLRAETAAIAALSCVSAAMEHVRYEREKKA